MIGIGLIGIGLIERSRVGLIGLIGIELVKLIGIELIRIELITPELGLAKTGGGIGVVGSNLNLRQRSLVL